MRTKYMLLAILSSLVSIPCNYPDFDEANNLKTKGDTYKYSGTSKSMLTHVYPYMSQGCQLFTISGGILTEDRYFVRDCVGDDSGFGVYVDGIQNTNNGSWSPIKAYGDPWALCRGIHAASSFIAEIAQADFTRREHDGQYTNWMKQLKHFPYKARILRVHYFFELVRRHSNIATSLEVLTEEEANIIGKTPFSEAINFIVSKHDDTVNNLPDSYADEPGAGVGRVIKGFAMAIKSEALPYAVSKLHNLSMDTKLWRKSAKAAMDIINTGLYSLDPQESANNLGSREVVLTRINGDDSDFEMFNFPFRITVGIRTSNLVLYSNYPLQNLVDAFETVNGYKATLENTGRVYKDSTFDPQSPYGNRDECFCRATLANGVSFKDHTIETFRGGADNGIVPQDGSPTGHFLRKYIQEATDSEPSKETVSKRHWVIRRYAETLLTYMESMADVFNDVNYIDETYKYSTLWAVNEVGKNIDMPLIPSMGKEDFFERPHNEQHVELAFEDHRFWDIRRRRIVDTTQRELRGVKAEKQADDMFNFYKNPCETCSWGDHMYLYPVSQNEPYKNTNLNPQDIGWQLVVQSNI